VSLYRVHSLFGRTKAFVLSRIRLRTLTCTRHRDTTNKYTETAMDRDDSEIGQIVNQNFNKKPHFETMSPHNSMECEKTLTTFTDEQ
jgi:hypothetical protein